MMTIRRTLPVLLVLCGCTVTHPVRELKTGSILFDGLRKASVLVVLAEPDVKDMYQNKADTKTWVLTGVRDQLDPAFQRKLQDTVAKVQVTREPVDAARADYVLVPKVEVETAYRGWTFACVARITLAVKDGKGKTLMVRDKQVERHFFGRGGFGPTCSRSLQEALDEVTDRVLEILDARAR